MFRSSLRLIAAAFFTAAMCFGVSNTATADDAAIWDGIREATFGTRPIEDGAGKIALEAPYRAEDASTVPISIHLPAAFANTVKSLTLVIDKNPAPIVATFTYGEAAGASDRVLATRVRIDQYSNVRVIAETTDGKLFMTYRFVKASGGCSAPAGKDSEEAAKSLGKTLVKAPFKDPDGGGLQEAQIMIRHPNNSGMQMDQSTGLYIPAHFVEKITVKTGDKVVFTMSGGISMSENPNLRFTYKGNPADVMTIEAEDTKGNVFKGHSNPSQS